VHACRLTATALPAAAGPAFFAVPARPDTKPDPTAPRLYKTIEAKELADKAGYSRPHTLHCGPDGVFLTCLGGANGHDGPGWIALLGHTTFDVIGPWESDRGSQYLAHDAGWHLNRNTLISSEWGTPSMIEDGGNPELLLGQKYGHKPALLGPRPGRPPPGDRPRGAAPLLQMYMQMLLARPSGSRGLERVWRIMRSRPGWLGR